MKCLSCRVCQRGLHEDCLGWPCRCACNAPSAPGGQTDLKDGWVVAGAEEPEREAA